MVRLAMCIIFIFALTGCSKQPLRDKSISEIKIMVDNWNFGRLSEQQSKGLAIANVERDKIKAQMKDETESAVRKAEKSQEEIGAELEAAILKAEEEFTSIKTEWDTACLTIGEKRKMEIWDKLQADREAALAINQSECKRIRNERDAEYNKLLSNFYKIDLRTRATNEYTSKLESDQEAAGQKAEKAIANADAEYEDTIKNANTAYDATEQERKAQSEAAYKKFETGQNKRDAELKFANEKAEQAKAKVDAEKENEILIAKEKAEKAEAIVDSKAQAELEAELGVKSIHAQSLFYDVFGKPKNKQSVGGNYYFYYNCKEGMVQLVIAGNLLDYGDEVSVVGVNVY